MAENPEIGKTVDAGGIATNCHDQGGGAPVVLLHGSGPGVTAWANWRLVLPPLAERFRVIAPDARGHGRSAHVGAGGYYHFPDYVSDLDGLVTELGLHAPTVVGHSMGGTVSCWFAAARPSAAAVRVRLRRGTGAAATCCET